MQDFLKELIDIIIWGTIAWIFIDIVINLYYEVERWYFPIGDYCPATLQAAPSIFKEEMVATLENVYSIVKGDEKDIKIVIPNPVSTKDKIEKTINVLLLDEARDVARTLNISRSSRGRKKTLTKLRKEILQEDEQKIQAALRQLE